MYTKEKLERLKMARRIWYRREELGMTRELFARKLGLSQSYITDVEYGTKGISTQTLLRMSQILKVPADYLLANTPRYDMEDSETLEIRERIVDYMCDLSPKELVAIEKICHAFVDTVRAKRPPVKNV